MATTPFSNIPRGSRQGRGRSPLSVGLIAIVIVTIVTYFAFTKDNPFKGQYELYAIFESANNLQERSPVRIAGVEVGKVKKVEPIGDSGMAKVRMEIQERGLPIKKDAQLKVRFRIFLEGNYFVDLQPGSPSAPELDSGSTIPPNQTAFPVQFGQVLTALQKDTRESLQTFLKEYSTALEGPGARGFNQAIRHWEKAFRSNALASDAYQGTEVHDLTRVLRGQGRTFAALSRNEDALRDLVVQLNIVAHAFARQEDNLRATIPQLRDVLRVGRPALASLNTALPSLRAFAREALPGARSTARTLPLQIPFVRQARRLVSRRELRGLVRDLRPTVPALAQLNRGNTRTLEQTRALGACQNDVLVPFSTTPIPDPDFPENSGESFSEQSPRALVGLSGESRLADANSPMFRVQAGAGPFTLVTQGETGDQYFAQLDLPLEGIRPVSPNRKPPFRPNVPCELQDPPDLNAPGAGPQESVDVNPAATPANLRRERRAKREFREVIEHMRRVAKGLPSVDPLDFSERGERMQARRLGLRRRSDGTYVDDRGSERRDGERGGSDEPPAGTPAPPRIQVLPPGLGGLEVTR